MYLSVPSQYVLSTTWNTWPNSVGAVPRKVGKGPLEYSAHSPLLAQAPWFGLRPHLTLGPAVRLAPPAARVSLGLAKGQLRPQWRLGPLGPHQGGLRRPI